ncbi:CbiK1 [Desulfamplus magnetovallimortis]|uniref:CbiK1 n=1 Tax=Desulfamplus magnetovallimortis TaxID=1246637 RepID=A0A1W1HG38_9BACT|nr:sirohydrochlorin cobaltochelatase [Desulfamplus magnetovallimortis]SLM31406.1 CbiK1 [Desulfamplus magnetovallimortis]
MKKTSTIEKTALFVMVFFFTLTISMSATANETTPKKAIVLAVFGTTYPTAIKSIQNLKHQIEEVYPDMPVKLAFTSEIIRAKWGKRANDEGFRKKHPEIPNEFYTAQSPLATIANLQDQGYRHIAVQSTHIFAGEEYQNLKAEIEALDSIKTLRERDKPFKKIILGRPALGEASDVFHYTEDIKHAAEILGEDLEIAAKKDSALVYMGHGNEIFSTGAYVELESALRDANPGKSIFIGTVEGYPGPEKVLAALKHAGVKKITLLPLMVVAGDHASNDMAGDEEDSWKSIFGAHGIEVFPVLRGLGEVDVWNEIYIKHLKEAIDRYNF